MAMGAYGLTQYNPAKVDQQRTQNRLRQMQVTQAENEMQRQNKLQEVMGDLYGGGSVGSQPATANSEVQNAILRREGGPTREAGAMMDRAQQGGGMSAARGGQQGGMPQINPQAFAKLQALDPETANRIVERRQSMREDQRAQEDREAVMFASMLDRVEQLPEGRRQQGYERMRQFAANRLGLDVSDMPDQYDPTMADMVRAHATATGEYEPPEPSGQDMPAAVREALFVTGGDEQAAREYLRQQSQGDGQADTLTERQVNRLAQRPVVKRLARRFDRTPQAMAQDIQAGYFDTKVTDEGRVLITDTLGTQTFELPIKRAEEAGFGGQINRRQQGQQSAGQDQGDETPEQRQALSRLQEFDPDDLFGPEAIGKTVLDQTFGILSESAQQPETRQARTAFKFARELASKALRSSGRVPLQEQQRILQLLPDISGVSGFFESQGGATAQVNQFLNELETVREAERQFAEDPANSSANRRAAEDRIRTLNQIIKSLSRVKGVGLDQTGERGAQTGGAVSERRQNRQQQDDGFDYDNLPPGRIRDMSQSELNKLDSSQMTEAQLKAAASAWDRVAEEGRQ